VISPKVLGPTRLLTKTSVKRKIAAAIAEAQSRNDWSDNDAGEILGCSDGTIGNRKKGDDPHNQMTVYELLRAATADPALANDIVALIDMRLCRIERSSDTTTDRRKASSITRAALAVSIMLEDDEISDEEIVERRRELEEGRDAFQALLDRIGPKGAVV
jgi:hypothetical protein